MEPLIVEQRAAMDSYDPGRKVGLIVDEWGTWHPAEPGRNPAFLWQQNTVRDALVAALTLDIFNRQAEKIVMGAIAQTINVLQALLLTEGDRMVKTPTYQVYDLYAPHQGATSVRLLAECEAVECVVDGRPQRLPVVAGSASVRDGSLTVTLVNSHATETIETEVRCLGASVADPEVRGLAYPTGDIRAHNTFESPEVVGLADSAPPAGATVELPPASVTRLTYRLG